MAQKGDHNASNEELRQPLFLPHLHEDPLDFGEGEGVFRGNSTALFEAWTVESFAFTLHQSLIRSHSTEDWYQGVQETAQFIIACEIC